MLDTLRETAPAPRHQAEADPIRSIDSTTGYSSNSSSNQSTDFSNAPQQSSTSHSHPSQSQYNESSSSGNSTIPVKPVDVGASSRDGTSHSGQKIRDPEEAGPAHAAGNGWSHGTDIGSHGTGHADKNEALIERLQKNVQQSVYETTGKTDPNVAEEQPKKGFGKVLLEGVGLGGDERKDTLRGDVD